MMDLIEEVNAIEPDSTLGPILTQADAPRLFEILERLSHKIGSRFPSEIRLSHLPTCGVIEQAINSYYRRPILVIGLPCLHVWSIDELKAVLAHELAHLRHQDAVFIREILGVTQTLRRRLESSEPAANSLRRSFARLCASWVESLARPASRWMEFRADHCSAETCGPEALSTAIEKMAIVQPIFREIIHLHGITPAGNVYQLFSRAWKGLHGSKYEQLRKRFIDESDWDESDLHPPVHQRINRLKNVRSKRSRQFYPSLHLLDNPPILERALHNQLFSSQEPPPSIFHPFKRRSRKQRPKRETTD
ncbi:M48 family metallopeptidase [bacterium]|nr:M48 family metallopeptidase [bacterium]